MLLIFALVVATVALGSEYHTFTSQDGQTVNAKIMAVSSYTGRVKLERETGKQVWVSIEMLSSEDQAFVQAWGKKKSIPKTPKLKKAAEEEPEGKILSKTEIRNIAKQYKKAWERHDYALWSSLLEIHQGHHLLNEGTFNREDVKSIMLRSVEGHNIFIEYNLVLGGDVGPAVGLVEKRHGWLQLLPDGKIKYTPILFQHPMHNAMDDLYEMFPFKRWGPNLLPEERLRIVQDSINNLERMGIPCFGYEIDSSESKRNNDFELILDWMIANWDSWDETEPKIPCPEDLFKEQLSRIKKMK